jgi:hypothetical protein
VKGRQFWDPLPAVLDVTEALGDLSESTMKRWFMLLDVREGPQLLTKYPFAFPVDISLCVMPLPSVFCTLKLQSASPMFVVEKIVNALPRISW